MFYDMNRADAACPKCKKALDTKKEIEAIRKKKAQPARQPDEAANIDNGEDELEVSDTEIFFDDMGGDVAGGKFSDDE